MSEEFVMPREVIKQELPNVNAYEILDNTGQYSKEYVELRKLNADVERNPDEYEPWDALVRAGEGLEGGLNRNSSPQAIAATREIYDNFLAKFPLFFVYWKRYADLEFHVAGTEAAEMIYERGVASVGNSVDLWTNYCAFKVETSHDPETIRELFERAAACVGLDYQSHPFWDKYMEYEERIDAPGRSFAILERITHIPMQKSREYFDKFRHLAQYRPVTELTDASILEAIRTQLIAENPNRSAAEIERDIRARIDAGYLDVFSRTQAEVAKRAVFETEIKRPYFHVTDLPEAELVNWRKYLDLEETDGDYQRVTFLYERCLVVCALYEEFWLRYARWMQAQHEKAEEVRIIFQRASCVYVPVSKPKVRRHYAIFEESQGRFDVAHDVYQSILYKLPADLETIVALGNLERRRGGIDGAIAVYAEYLKSSECDMFVKGRLVGEWASLLWKIKGSPDEARQVYQKNAPWYAASRPFWVAYFQFELEQPTSAETEAQQYERIKGVWQTIFEKSSVAPSVVKILAHVYLEYLLQRGTAEAAKEYLQVDREINGPLSIRTNKTRLPEDASGFGSLYLEGNVGANSSAASSIGHNIFDRYYRDPTEMTALPGVNGQQTQHRL